MKLSVFKGNEQLATHDLSEHLSRGDGRLCVFIGRSEECLIRIDDPQVSREHASVSYDGSEWRVKRESENALLIVNGEACEEKNLQTGDVISVGHYTVNIFVPFQRPVEEEHPSDSQEDLSRTEMLVDEGEFESEESADSDDPVELDDLPDLDSSAEDVHSDDEDEEKESSDSDFEDSTSEEDDHEDGESNEYEGNDEYSTDGEFDESNEYEEQNEYDDQSFGDGFSDEDNALAEVDEGTQVVRSFAKFELEIFGEFAPYDKYLVEAEKILVGRDQEKCQIVLNDPEVSNVHTLIQKSNITCTIEDQNSANGTILNGVRVNKAELTNGDEFIVGSTTFTVRISSDFLEQEQHAMMPVDHHEVVEVEEEIEEIVEDGDDFENLDFGEEGAPVTAAENKSLLAKFKAMPPIRKIMVVVMILGAILFLGDEPPKKKKAVKGKKTDHSLEKKEKKATTKKVAKTKVKLTPEQEQFVESAYLVARDLLETGRYADAIFELQKIFEITPDYKESKQLFALAKEGLQKLEDLEKKRQKEIEAKQRKEKIKQLIIKAKEAVKEHKEELATGLFSKILELDPENFDVAQLKLELDAWVKKKQAEELEKATKEAERRRKVEALKPGKTLYIKKEWYKAIGELSKFLDLKDMDEDLIVEAQKMLSSSKKSLNDQVNPLIGKARSLKEGQDLKGAYRYFQNALDINPEMYEAMSEMDEIREILNKRARKLFREGLISESVSDFPDAKEKFREVQQISPTDSDYYRKATEKLDQYWE